MTGHQVTTSFLIGFQVPVIIWLSWLKTLFLIEFQVPVVIWLKLVEIVTPMFDCI
uniref:Uncharacterized protein n=1 Tax=Rhizophora mucronata TaxID=61149 RepID=A0A2P2NE20_RHIMU